SANNYTGGTYVNSGTLMLGTGTAIPANSAVIVAAGAQFNIGSFSNTGAAIGTLTLNGGTFRVPSGSGDYYLNQLNMTGGTVDFSGSGNFWLHFTGASAGITLNYAYPGANWIGSGSSRIQNDTASPLNINMNNGTLNVGIILSNAGTNPNFVFHGGLIRLSNAGNTANITVNNLGQLYSNDLSTNVGAGAFGTLGAGTITLNNGYLVYDGPAATTAKPLTLAGPGGSLALAFANLTMTGVIGESAAGAALTVNGPLTY